MTARGRWKSVQRSRPRWQRRVWMAPTQPSRRALHQRIFALAMRYKSLQGAGFQAAIGPPVWHVLRSALGVACEGFASPLNAYLPAFGSGFVDVDGPFGSRGSFFGFKPSSGSFELNPPFVHNIMDAAAAHVVALLKAAAEAQGDHARVLHCDIARLEGVRTRSIVLSESHSCAAACSSPPRTTGSATVHPISGRTPTGTRRLTPPSSSCRRTRPRESGRQTTDSRRTCVPRSRHVCHRSRRSGGSSSTTQAPRGKLTGSSKRKQTDSAGDGARKKKARAPGGRGGRTHDAEIEAELDAWVRAKRQGNFEKADEIRAQLREKGIATEKERPFKRKEKAL